MNYEAVTYLISVLLVFCVWWLFFVEQQRCWLSMARQTLFKIRDDLFDEAVKGEKITFDDPAYRMTRDTLNGMIRFTHTANLLYFISIYLGHKFIYKGRRSTDYSTQFDMAIHSLPKGGKCLVLRSIAEAHLLLLRHVISTSPFLWPIFKPASIIIAALHLTKKLKKKMMRGKKNKNKWSIIDAEANYVGTHIPRGCAV